MEKADVLEMTVTYLRAMQQKDTRTEGEVSGYIYTIVNNLVGSGIKCNTENTNALCGYY